MGIQPLVLLLETLTPFSPMLATPRHCSFGCCQLPYLLLGCIQGVLLLFPPLLLCSFLPQFGGEAHDLLPKVFPLLLLLLKSTWCGTQGGLWKEKTKAVGWCGVCEDKGEAKREIRERERSWEVERETEQEREIRERLREK